MSAHIEFERKLHGWDIEIYPQRYQNVSYITTVMLRTARHSRGMTIRESAEIMGIKPVELYRMEKGLLDIPREYICRFMKAYSYPKKFFYQEVIYY